MNRKVLSLVVALLMVVSLVPLAVPAMAVSNSGAATKVSSAPQTEGMPAAVKVYLNTLYAKYVEEGKPTVRVIIAPVHGKGDVAVSELRKLGAKIDPMSMPKYDFIVAEVPVQKLLELENIKAIRYVWEDKTVSLPEPSYPEKLPKVPIQDLKSGSGGFNPFMWDMDVINAPLAREKYGTDGDGVVIAIIDTGADVAQPYLQVTPEGKRKIIAWRDDTGEGAVSLDYNFTSSDVVNGTVVLHLANVTIDWGRYYFFLDRASRYTTIPQLNLTVDFGNVTVENGTYKVGFLPERYFDINFDHNFDELYAVIVAPDNITYFYPVPLQLNTTDANTLHATYVIVTPDNRTITKVNETILESMMVIPEGVNYAFTVSLDKAQAMRPFDLSGDYILLGPGVVDDTTYVTFELGKPSITKVANGTAYMSVVLATFGDDEVVFGWDGGQHGTHVSGTAAGYGAPNPNYPFPFNIVGLTGVAPGAQLIEIKSLSSIGYGSTSWIVWGMIHAALMGADVISMSLGGLYEGYNDGLESPENYFANLLTDLFGVVFAIAAGNEGPTTNTVGTPGDSDFAITVGAYWSSDAWEFWYRFTGVADGPTSFSSRGPRLDGAVKPDIMAPGEFVFSILPIWSVGSFGTWASDFWGGTSMATPHVSGAVALMISYAKANGLRYDPFLIKRALMLSAEPVEGATPIDQGAGLMKVDKAIEEMIKLSKEKTTFIYAGTTFGPYTNALGEKELPLIANVIFNGWFLDYGLPYLYQGIYLRNDRPATVPVYVYGMVYEHGLQPVGGTYKVSASAPWIHVSTSKVTANIVADRPFEMGPFLYPPGFLQTTGMFYVTVDYSKLQFPGTYVGYVYIDDPSTSYIDGMVPVIVTVPINKGPTGELSDSEKPGQAKHYYIDVPVGTHELVVSVSIPKDKDGKYMGRAWPFIVDPRGRIVNTNRPDLGWFLGAGGKYGNYTWVIKNPTPGTWELTVYSSVSTMVRTGYDESHYDVKVQVLSVTPDQKRYYFDYERPGNYTFKVRYSNTYGTLNVIPFAYGLGNLLMGQVELLNITQDEWQVVDLVNATPEQKLYYLRMGITSPKDPNADLDLYVVYFANDAVLRRYLPLLYNQRIAQLFILYAYYGLIPGVKVYLDQVGPTADESFDSFMPEYGYYVAVVNGYDVPEDELEYVYYRQALKDRGQMSSLKGDFKFKANTETNVKYGVELTDNGTYLGVVGLLDGETGVPVAYAPVFFQVGMPTMTVALNGNAKLGKPSKFKLVILDTRTMKPIEGEATVYVNGQEHIAVNGVLEFTYTPTSTREKLRVKVISPNYQDVQKTFVLHIAEPVSQPVRKPDEVKALLVSGDGKIEKLSKKPGEVHIVVNGPHGTRAKVLVVLPQDTLQTKITGADVVDWKIVKGKKAVYALVTVEFHSPAEFTLKYDTHYLRVQRTLSAIESLNFLYYRYIKTKNATFEELYQKALKAGVNETVLKQAMDYYKASMEEYKKAEERAGGVVAARLADFRLFPYLRKSYVNLRKAIELLQKALEAQGS